MYILVPVPNLETKANWEKAENKLKQQVIQRINKEFNLNLSKHIETEASFWTKRF